jgi:hypothetical protein
MDAAQRDYIQREWWRTRAIWVLYAKQHSCLLLQCMTTNAVESWHASLKKHAEGTRLYWSSQFICMAGTNYLIGKATMRRFTLEGCAAHVLHIGDQWCYKAREAKEKWRTTRSAECTTYPDLAKFPGHVQSLLVSQLKLAEQANADAEAPLAKELGDNVVCPMDCMFYPHVAVPLNLRRFHLTRLGPIGLYV